MNMPKQKFEMPDGEIIEKDMPIWKTPWNHDTDFESRRTGSFNKEPSLTKQEFKEETNIQFLLERFMKGGEPPPIVLPEHFLDATQQPTYYEMQSRIADANSNFYKLDASMRSRFLNDPALWADAVVTAVNEGDKEFLEECGIELKPQEAATATPDAGGATPAPGSAKAPPAPPPGAPKAADQPAAKTETPKT